MLGGTRLPVDSALVYHPAERAHCHDTGASMGSSCLAPGRIRMRAARVGSSPYLVSFTVVTNRQSARASSAVKVTTR